jgi:hypothetical protein
MATRKPKKKAAPKKASAKKAPAKKAAKKTAKKAAKKKAAKSTAKASAAKKKAPAKKAAAKKAPAKKAASKKAASKKAAKKKAPPKKAAAKKKEAAKPSAKRPRPERAARRAKPDLPQRDVEETTDLSVDEADVIAIEDDELELSDEDNGVSTHRRKRPKTSLPPDHEVLDPGPMRGEPVDKGTVIEAIRAAFKADEEHPVRGREFLGARSPVDVPQEGDVDYARAIESQKAAAEVLAGAEMAGEERKAVDDRIAEVYAREARYSMDDEEE